jgi:acyl dehydratase
MEQSQTYGRITDEGLERLRARIGQGFTGRRPWRTEITRDAIYHLALAIGDLSPMYLDEEYARKTRWGTLLAPPIIVQTMDTLRAVGHSGLPEGLPGVHSIWTGSYYEWVRPPMLGDRIHAESYLKEVREKESRFGGGRAVYQTYEAKYYDQDGHYIGLRNDTWIRVERQKTAEKKKYGHIQLAQWTKEDFERFCEEYRNEQRTAERYWEDVRIGEPIHRLIKGPLTPTAEIAFESYFGIYLVGNVVAAQLYQKHPALMIPNEQGVPEPPQRVHWDNAFTQRLLGLPGAYDLGPERCSWLIQGVTNWIGNNAFITKIEARYLKFNFMGDVTWVQGKVTDKYLRDGKGYVRFALECVNHRDEVTATADAEAELPLRSAAPQRS